MNVTIETVSFPGKSLQSLNSRFIAVPQTMQLSLKHFVIPEQNHTSVNCCILYPSQEKTEVHVHEDRLPASWQNTNREFGLNQTGQENCCRHRSALPFTGGCTIAPDFSKYFSAQDSIISSKINNSF